MAKRSRQPSVADPSGQALDLADREIIPEFKIAIAFPSHDKVDSLFAHSLAELSAYTAAALLASGAEFEYGIKAVYGTYLHKARTEILKDALKDNVSHLLWVDSDMIFPKDAFIRLMGHGKTIVGANYSQRGLPPDWVAIKQCSPGVKCETKNDSTGLEKVEAIGFGCVLFDMRVIREKLPSDPWFGIGDVYGEDVWFCKKMGEEHGVEIFVDHDLSKEVRHIGTYQYVTTAVETWREVHGKDN